MEQGRRATDRKAVGLLVKLKHSDVGSFAEEFATNLSPGGMFIRTRTPQAVGTLVKFEVQIAGGVRVLRGTAVVRWVRETADEEGPPGMGLQFQELDPVTQSLIDRMLQLSKAAAAAAGPAGMGGEPSVDAEALEREMLAKGMLDRVGKRITASRLPAIAPSVAPVARTAPKPGPGGKPPEELPSGPILSDERLEESADLGALMDDLESIGSPVGKPAAPPAYTVHTAPTPVPLAVPPPAEDDVDIAVDDLLAAAPESAPASAEVKFEVLDEPMPDIDFEMESLGGDLPVAMGMPLEEAEPAPVVQGQLAPPPPAPQAAPARPAAPLPPVAKAYPAVAPPQPPAPPVQAPPAAQAPAAPQAQPPAPPAAAPLKPAFDVDVELGLVGPKLVNQSDSPDFKPGKGVEFELDLGSGEDIDVDKPGQKPRRKAAPGRAPPLPAAPAPASSGPPPAAPRAFPASAGAPEARAEAPRPPAPAPAGTAAPAPSAAPAPAPVPPRQPVPEPSSRMAFPPTVFLTPPAHGRRAGARSSASTWAPPTRAWRC